MKAYALALLILVAPAVAFAQENPSARAARQWRQQHEHAIVDEFVAFLKIPNLSTDTDGIHRNADALVEMLERRGVAARQISVAGSNPVVFGEIRTAGATRTLGFYAHYDGASLDPREWTTPPFEPVLRDKAIENGGKLVPMPPAGSPFDPESRLYARGSGDDKAPIQALLSALDSMRAAGQTPKANIKFAFEGEEEAGSINLEKILVANRSTFAADLWFVCDTPVHQTRRQSIVFGARGSAALDVTVYGPRVELHSGHYGAWAPNPAQLLAQLLASMKSADGHVLVKGFYDGVAPLGAMERQAVAEAPAVDAELMRELWLGATDNAPRKLAELLNEPTLNVRGISSARIGSQASNVIPTTATASIDVRPVKGMDLDRTLQRVVDHIRAQGYFVVEKEPDAATRMAHARVALVTIRPGGYAGGRTPMDLLISQDVIRTVESVRGPAVKIPSSGGSIPLTMIDNALGTRTIVMPIANHDDNQHTFDENLRLQNLWDGIELMAALLTM
jgi:acetylornithine deacetylase/succinyl-diaminopimelate desuccinylase-like protein